MNNQKHILISKLKQQPRQGMADGLEGRVKEVTNTIKDLKESLPTLSNLSNEYVKIIDAFSNTTADLSMGLGKVVAIQESFAAGINKVVKNISVDFHERQSKGKSCFSWIEKKINLLDKENKLVAWINEVTTFGIMNIRTKYLKLVIKQEDKDIVQTIKKENIVRECYSIHNYISECIQNYYSD